MAPSTPPPPRRLLFAAFTMASMLNVVMSPRKAEITVTHPQYEFRRQTSTMRAAPGPDVAGSAQAATIHEQEEQ